MKIIPVIEKIEFSNIENKVKKKFHEKVSIGDLVSVIYYDLEKEQIRLQVSKLNILIAQTLKEEVAIGYGALGEALIDFLVVGFTVFVVVKFMNRLRKRAHDNKDKAVAPPKDIELLSKLTSLMEEQNALLKSKK